MDRRDALKKLGVGGAVAISAPVLLDSFNVANALSAWPSSIGAVASSGAGGAVVVSLTNPFEPGGPFPAGTTFQFSLFNPPHKVSIISFTTTTATVDYGPGSGSTPAFTMDVLVTVPGLGTRTYRATGIVPGGVTFT